MTTALRPVLRYAGSKWRLTDTINALLPVRRVYLEPFFGSGAVYFRRPLSEANILNDRDELVCNLYRVIRDQPNELCAALEMTPWSRNEWEWARNAEEQLALGEDVQAHTVEIDPVEKARRFLVRNWQGFGSHVTGAGGWRRVIGYADCHTILRQWAQLPERLQEAACHLRCAMIENRDALTLIEEYAHPDCSIYADPPYLPETIRDARFYRHILTPDEHGRLLGLLAAHPGPAVLSGYAHETYDRALEGWKRYEVKANADAGRRRVEILWANRHCNVQPSLFGEEEAA